MFTVLGASGFIGHHLTRELRQRGFLVQTAGREDNLSQLTLGDVIYCIGLTSDFRGKPLETVDAHSCKLFEIVRYCDFTSILYLSSARIYRGLSGRSEEEDTLEVAPLNPDDLYNTSKILGEALLFASGRKVRVVRLSNVYGDDFISNNFLSAVIKEAISGGRVLLHTSPESERDYISVRDVVNGLIRIATEGKEPIYNLASGGNTSHRILLDRISKITGCVVEFLPDAPTASFPPISIDRMRGEFGFNPSCVLDDVAGLIDLYSSNRSIWNDKN